MWQRSGQLWTLMRTELGRKGRVVWPDGLGRDRREQRWNVSLQSPAGGADWVGRELFIELGWVKSHTAKPGRFQSETIGSDAVRPYVIESSMRSGTQISTRIFSS